MSAALAAVNGPVKMGDTARFANLRTKAGSKLAKLKELKAKNTLLDKQVAKLEKEAKAAGTVAEKATGKAAALNEKLAAAEKKLTAAKKAISESKDKNNQLSKEAAQVSGALEKQLAETNKELDAKKAEFKQLTASLDSQTTAGAAQQGTIKKQITDLKKLDAQNSKLQKGKAKCESDREKLTEEAEGWKNEIRTYQGILEDLENDFDAELQHRPSLKF